MGYYWTEERINEDLKRIMNLAFDSVYETSKVFGCTMRIAAFVVAVERVNRAAELRGLYA